MIQLNFFARRSADWRSVTDSDTSSDQYGSTPSLDMNDPVRPELDSIQIENLEQMKEMDKPLNSTWDVYYLRNDVGADWDDRLVKVASFSTILEFWSVYLYLKLPNQLQAGCDYMIFRDGIKPEWTDPNNQNGGRWLIEIDRKQRNEQLNDKWLETLLAVIGEQLEPDEVNDHGHQQICGAMVQSRRRVDRVGLWTRNAEDGDLIMDIGQKYSSKIKPQWGQRLRFQSHKSTQDRTGSYQSFQFEI
jgi:translation initiation factor 4E